MTHLHSSNKRKRKHSRLNDDQDDQDDVVTQDDVYRIGAKVFFNTDVNARTAGRLIKLLTEADEEITEAVKRVVVKEKKQKNRDKHHIKTNQALTCIEINPTPIELYITTYGGLLHAAWAIVDVIHNLRVPVHTIVSGFVASAGTLISLAGEKRIMGKNAYMLIHEVRSSCWGKFSEICDDFENTQTLMDHIILYYKENTKIPESELKDVLVRDRNWSAEECKKKGLIDEIN